MLQVLWTVTILKFSYIMYRQPKIGVTNTDTRTRDSRLKPCAKLKMVITRELMNGLS